MSTSHGELYFKYSWPPAIAFASLSILLGIISTNLIGV